MTTPIRPDAHFRLPPDARLGLVAGSGRLPRLIAEGRRTLDKGLMVLAIAGEADPADYADFQTIPFDVNGFAELGPTLKRQGVTHVVFAGGVAQRPSWQNFRPSLRLAVVLGKALRALAGGDNALLSTMIADLESQGLIVVGPHQLDPDLVTGAGVLTSAAPSTSDRRDLDAALEAALAIGTLDIGQAAIAVGGRAVALEGVEGTSGLLDRMQGLRDHGRLAGKTRGALVKAAKPGQELRIDLPSIGVDTVVAAHAAGLAGIGVEAERSLLIDRAATIAKADALGLFIVGLETARDRQR